MKINQLCLGSLAIVMTAVYPAFTFAAPPTTSAYYTDTQNIFVQDQTSDVLSGLNNVLCHIEAMRPDAMVGNGNYVALVDRNICNANGSGGKSSNTGPSYVTGIVNSTKVGATMLANAWFDEPAPQAQKIYAHISATQAPSATQPYGLFRVDFCGVPTGTACAMEGYIDVTVAGGVKYFSLDTWTYGGVTMTMTDQLQLNGASLTAGSGSMSRIVTGTWAPPAAAFKFAYDANLFHRAYTDGTNEQCFSRDPLQAAESVWSYNLYDMTTGAQVTRNSGFPILYTDANGSQNGYIGYYGLWTPTTPTSTTVNQVTYGANGEIKTPYTLLQTGGKLLKHTTSQKTLAAVDKQHFWFGSNRNMTVAGVPSFSTWSTWVQYELYWDNTNLKFYVSGQQDPTTFNMVPLTTPVAISTADMLTATSYSYFNGTSTVTVNNGLNAWTQSGQWSIDGTAMANLATTLSTTAVLMVSEDVIYPDATSIATVGTLKCVFDCPQAIAAGGPFAFLNDYWITLGKVTAAQVQSYTLGASGNLMNGTTAAVNLTATSQFSSASNMQGSGKLVDAAAWTTITTANPTGVYSIADLGKVTTFYTWQSSTNQWDQLSVLKDSTGTMVKFDPPLPVNFAVPNLAKYGNYANSTIQLQYGGVGDLWGIPSRCVDMTNNTPCTFGTGGTAQANMRWAPDFSIPFDSTVGVVTVANTVGAVTAGTQYLVKGLDVERRLLKVALTTCTAAGLTLPTTAITLPDATSFLDPGPAGGANYIGAMPVLNPMPAPRVIHGDVKY